MILATGGTGTVGGYVVRQLALLGVPVRALVRDPAKAQGLTAPGVEIVQGDLTVPESLDLALRGIEKVFLVSPSGPDQIEREGNMVRAAKLAGVKRFVRVSVIAASSLSTINLVRWHWYVERMIEDADLSFTHLRPHFFMQNMLYHAQTIASEGKFYTPSSSAKIAAIDARDIAAVAVAALTEIGHEHRIYELTGPEALTNEDVAQKLSAAFGRTITHVEVTQEDARKAMLEEGVPEWLIEDAASNYRFFDEGHGALVTRDVAKVTGRPAMDFNKFASDHADIFRTGQARAA